MLLGMSLACIGLAVLTQTDAQALGWRWGGNVCCDGDAGLGFGYRHNFGGPGGCGAYVGLGYVGDPYAGYGYVQSGPLVPGDSPYRYLPATYGQGRCGFGLNPTSDTGAPRMPGTPKVPSMYPSTWRGYAPFVDVASCGTMEAASGSASQSIASSPASEPADIATASLARRAP
jgi:hypothetical protein